MSIVERAKQLAEEERQEQILKEDESRREEQQELNELNAVRDEVRKLLIDLGNNGFTVDYCDGLFGRFAALKHKSEYLGFVCVKWVTYQFKGSDESPEEDFREIEISLCRTLNSPSDVLVRAMDVSDFEERMAEYLKKFF